MNLLSREKRIRIAQMHIGGATVREIARLVGVNRETVSAYVGRQSRARTALRKALDQFDDELRDAGVEASEFDGYLRLYGLLHFDCPMHPEAEPDIDVGPDRLACRLCQVDGLKRHHERRRAEGRPIVPPRPKKKATDDSGADETKEKKT